MKAIQLSNAEKPDLILLTGDYITNSTNSVKKLASQLNLLTSKKDVACCVYPRKSYNFKRLMYSMHTESDSKESLDSRG